MEPVSMEPVSIKPGPVKPVPIKHRPTELNKNRPIRHDFAKWSRPCIMLATSAMETDRE
jgi:hypothetical protein